MADRAWRGVAGIPAQAGRRDLQLRFGASDQIARYRGAHRLRAGSHPAPVNDRSVPPGDGADPPGTEPSRADDPRHENVGGVFDELANAFASARESVAALLELLLLELRRASLSLV